MEPVYGKEQIPLDTRDQGQITREGHHFHTVRRTIPTVLDLAICFVILKKIVELLELLFVRQFLI